jgi:hypothetical protein
VDMEGGEQSAGRVGENWGGAGMVPRRGRGVEARVGSIVYCLAFSRFVFVFVMKGMYGQWVGKPHQLVTDRRRGTWVVYICHGRKAAVCNVKKTKKQRPEEVDCVHTLLLCSGILTCILESSHD